MGYDKWLKNSSHFITKLRTSYSTPQKIRRIEKALHCLFLSPQVKTLFFTESRKKMKVKQFNGNSMKKHKVVTKEKIKSIQLFWRSLG